MNLGINQRTDPVGAGHKLVMAISKASAKNVILHSYSIPLPYTGQTNLHTFAGIDDVLWYYQLFESLDGSPSGTVVTYFDVQAGVNTYATRDDLYLTADDSPYFASNTNFYGEDLSLIGWKWSLERIGQGTREVNVKYVKTKKVAGVTVDTVEDDPEATGWRTYDPLDLIGINEEWCIHFYPQLQSQPMPSGASLISATQTISGNTTLDASAIKQTFWLKGLLGYFEVTLPDPATVPDNEPIFFISSGGAHKNVGIKCTAGTSFQWYKNSADLASDTRATRLVWGQEEEMAFYKITLPDSSTRWMILYGQEYLRQVGKTFMSYSKLHVNAVPFDGTAYSRSVYVRGWEFVNDLDNGCFTTDAAFNNAPATDGINYATNHGKFTRGDGSNWRMPNLVASNGAGIGFLRIVDGIDRLPGSHQKDAIIPIQHEGTTGTLPLTLFGKGATRRKGNYNGDANGPTDLTGPPGLIVDGVFQAAERVSFETRPVNTGIYLMMCI